MQLPHVGKSSCASSPSTNQPLGIPFQFSPPPPPRRRTIDGRGRTATILLLLCVCPVAPPVRLRSATSIAVGGRGQLVRQSHMLHAGEINVRFSFRSRSSPAATVNHDAMPSSPCHRQVVVAEKRDVLRFLLLRESAGKKSRPLHK